MDAKHPLVGLGLGLVALVLLRGAWKRTSAVDPGLEGGGDKLQREVEKKRKLAEKSAGEAAATTPRLLGGKWAPGSIPPKNFKTKNWLVTDLSVPISDPTYCLSEDTYRLRICVNGVERRVLTVKDIEAMCEPREFAMDWSCVTGWTKLDLKFVGVPVRQLLGEFEGENWTCLYQKSADGYTCPVFREDATRDECFFALRDEYGALLSFEHGGPRFVFPALWGWKSAKWMTEIDLLPAYQAGFWEKLMCHARGRVYDADLNYIEERWEASAQLSHDFLTWQVNLYHKIFGPRAYQFMMWLGGKVVGLVFRPMYQAWWGNPSTSTS